jgi:RNA polymerase sigma factor (TIGR02999 family)
MPSPSQAITQLLGRLRDGEREALDDLFPLVYQELHGMAHRQLAYRRPGQTIDTTALVHEAYLKLVDQRAAQWQDRNHFFAVAARTMRHILVDYARRRNAQKRGGGQRPILLDDNDVAVDARAMELLALDDALKHLATLNERLSQVVELRFFGGLSVAETAQVLDISERTVKRDWRKARAFLYHTLQDDAAD